VKPINIMAFPSSGRDTRRVLTYFLIVWLALIVLNGLMTLSILNAFRLMLIAMTSIILEKIKLIKIAYPDITITKSITFHPSLK
jgi:hypothetical protein